LMRRTAVIYIIIVLVAGLVLVVPGCWNRREVETLGFVLAAAVDKAPEAGKLMVTVLIAKPQALAGGGDTAGSPREKPFWVTSSTGYTVFEAVRNFLSESPRRLFWAHNRFIVLGEELAREGIHDVLDFFNRDGETRWTVMVMVSKGIKGSDFLHTQFALAPLPPEGGTSLLEVAGMGLSTVPRTTLNDFLIDSEAEGVEPVTVRTEAVPVQSSPEQAGEKEKGELLREDIQIRPRVTGAAVFKADRLVGWLNKPETRGLLWVQGKTKSGILVIKLPGQSGGLVGLEMIRANSRVTPEIKDGKPRIRVQVRAEAAIGDVRGMVEPLKNQDVILKMERRMATVIRNEILAALDKARALKSDFFGFGASIHRGLPREWSRLRERWDEEFSSLAVDIEVKATIRRSGLTTRTTRTE